MLSLQGQINNVRVWYAVTQLAKHLIGNQEAVGSNGTGTIFCFWRCSMYSDLSNRQAVQTYLHIFPIALLFK